MVLPSMRNRILERQSNDVQRHNSHAVNREFCIGDSVWCLNFQASPKWLAGVIEEKFGLVTFSVRLSDNRTWRRHQDHILSKHPTEETVLIPPSLPWEPCVVPLPLHVSYNETKPVVLPAVPEENDNKSPESIVIKQPTPVVEHRSSGVVKSPNRLNL